MRLLNLFICFAGLAALGQTPPDAARASESRIRGAIDESRRVTLRGHVPRQASPLGDSGPVESAFPLPGITLHFKPSAAQQQELDRLLQQQQDPASAGFHKWLTPEEFAGRFALAPSGI